MMRHSLIRVVVICTQDLITQYTELTTIRYVKKSLNQQFRIPGSWCFYFTQDEETFEIFTTILIVPQ